MAPRGPLPVEAPGDVRFLLVHHSATTNEYSADKVPTILRDFFALHTGPEKGWPDIAYNFLIDRFGTVWEGRQGSRDAPVRGDATGGSQGYAQLACFIGDHRFEPPTQLGQAAMVSLLGDLCVRYGIDPAPGATATFTSRGSNRWPAGATVTTATIAGHRDMSTTECPGDAAYGLIRTVFAPAVVRRVAAVVEPTTTTTTTTTTSTTTPTTSTTPPTSRPSSSSAPADPAERASGPARGKQPDQSLLAASVVGALAVGLVGGAIALRRRRT